jgi:hypothetical protein
MLPSERLGRSAPGVKKRCNLDPGARVPGGKLCSVIPFPLPPALAKLHGLLESYTGKHEEGFFMAEQDQNRQFRAQPVLVFVSPESLRQDPETAPKRSAPDWIGEILTGEPRHDRMERYAKAGVKEYWTVDLGITPDGVGPARIDVHTGPRDDGTFEEKREFVGDDQVESMSFPELKLRPRYLA